MTQIHDTHAHLELLLQKMDLLKTDEREFFLNEKKEDFDFEIRELEGLIEKHKFIIQAGISTRNFLLVHELFKKVEKIYYLIGSHPEIVDEKFDVKNYLEEQKELLKPFLADLEKNKIIGIGETGLDYFYTDDQEIKAKQRDLFESQINLAIELNLPIEIHTRDAWNDTFAILENFEDRIKGKFLVHCFTGGPEEMEKIINLGGMVAFGGVTTFKNAKDIQEAFGACPEDRFVLETDLPFLAPTPLRGKTCLPEYIDNTAEFLTSLKPNLTKEEIWVKSEKNSRNLFKI